jgi:hypothetical protein
LVQPISGQEQNAVSFLCLVSGLIIFRQEQKVFPFLGTLVSGPDNI